jgi:hypothetical protein
VAGQPHFLAARPTPRPSSTRSFPIAFYPLRAQHLCCGMVKFRGKEGFSPFKSLNSSPSPPSLRKLLFILSPAMDPFNALSTAVAARNIPPLKEAPPAKVMSYALVASTDLEKTVDATKEVTRGAGAPSTKLVGRSANSPSRTAMVCGQSVPRDEGRSPPVCQGFPYTRGHGTRPTSALSPHPMIGKEYRSVMPTCPTTGILTPKKVTARRQLVVPSSSNNDDL